MPRFSLRTRIAVVLLIASLTPLVAFAVALSRNAGPPASVGELHQLLVAFVVVAIALAILLSVALIVLIGRDLDEITRLTERVRGGDFSTPSPGAPSDELAQLASAHSRLAASLEVRDRQLHDLALHVSAATITAPASEIAGQVVMAARDVTGDPTWSLAVLVSPEDSLLSVGTYEPGQPVAPVEELHRWASTVRLEERELDRSGGMLPAIHAEGPWGAFVLVQLESADGLRAVLYAPWEGRPLPSTADLGLFSLLGQNAATAIDHALLYARRNEQAAAMDRMAVFQRDFLRAITHDLQTPLTSIRVLASELREASPLPDDSDNTLALIEQQAERLRRMVSQLLAVSRLEAGALVPRQDLFREEPIIRRAWEALHLADHPFILESGGENHLVVGDTDRFEQILWAVLENAAKYSDPGSEIAVRVDTSPMGGGGLVSVVTVRDAGHGMDSATTAQAFDQFFRGEQARERVPDGAGIGLYAARGLARAMGGDISAVSRRGRGTTMRIRLPAEPAGAEAAD